MYIFSYFKNNNKVVTSKPVVKYCQQMNCQIKCPHAFAVNK